MGDPFPGNLLVNPNLPNGAPWGNLTGLGSVAVGLAGAPDGTSTKWSLTDLDATNVTGYDQPITTAADTGSRLGLVFIPKGAPAGHYASLDLRYGNDPLAPDKYALIVMDTATGAAIPRPAAWTPPSYGSVDWNANWWLYWLQLVNAGYTTLTLNVSPAYNSDGTGNPDVNASGTTEFWFGAIIAGSTPPSPSDGSLLALL